MNIIHLIRASTWGGGERYALDLCRAAAAAGHNVVAATKGAKMIDEKFAEAGATLQKLPLGGPLDLRSPFMLARIIREMPGEEVIIHVHTFKDAEIAARARKISGNRKRVKIVCTRHLVKPGKRSPRWRFIYRNIDSLIFVSELAKNAFLEGRPDIDSRRIKVVHNSIALPPEYAAVPPAPASSSKLTLLYTGRISPEKGLETLISSITLLAGLPLILRIAGTGNEKYIRSLKTLAQEKGIEDKIEWLGFVPDIFAEIRKADICVAPSVCRESFGLTIIEFMSQGKPVVTTGNGAQPEIITPLSDNPASRITPTRADGVLVPPSDPEALAAAIRRVAQDPSLRKKIGENAARTFTSRFAYPIFFNKIMEIYSYNSINH